MRAVIGSAYLLCASTAIVRTVHQADLDKDTSGLNTGTASQQAVAVHRADLYQDTSGVNTGTASHQVAAEHQAALDQDTAGLNTGMAPRAPPRPEESGLDAGGAVRQSALAREEVRASAVLLATVRRARSDRRRCAVAGVSRGSQYGVRVTV